MNPLVKRRENDLKKIKELEKKYPFFKIHKTEGNPIKTIELEFHLEVPVSSKKKEKKFLVKIDLPSNYPLVSPKFTIIPPIFHPHVYESGTVCMGSHWLVSNTLDLELERLIKILLFDPLYINPNSVANFSAYNWYKRNKKKLSKVES
ncbi:MAG: ubiquitin-conjugating enzyme E2 [Leptonema sp. (in: bacteria)]